MGGPRLTLVPIGLRARPGRSEGAGDGGNAAAGATGHDARTTGEARPAQGGDSRGTGTGIAAGTVRGGTTEAEPGKKASPWQRKEAAPRQGNKGQDDKAAPGRGKTARMRPGRRVTIVAVVALVLVAGTLAVVGIARSGGGPSKPEFTLVTPYPPAVAADTELAGRTAGATPLLASLTGIAAAGKTVVAIGAEPSQPAPVPLILFSADGGHTWTRAALAGPGAETGAGTGASPGIGQGAAEPAGPGLTTGPGAAGSGNAAGPGAAGGPGTAPVLIAHGGSTWLALGQYAAWTSADGRTWHPAPGLPPVAGDTVLGLAGTGTGFVAVGEHTGAQPGPVVWTSSAGRPWQRWTGPTRGLTARSGHVTALRWAGRRGRCGRGRRPDRRGRRAGPAP